MAIEKSHPLVVLRNFIKEEFLRDKRMSLMCDLMLLHQRLIIGDSSILKENLCERNSTKNHENLINAEAPCVINI